MTRKTNTEYVRDIRAREPDEKRAARNKANRERMAARRAAKRMAQGGAEPRRGPKQLIEGDPTSAKSITLPESYWRVASEIGDGVFSAGIRIAVEEARQHREATARRKARK